MPAPVYNPQPYAKNRPLAKKDTQGNIIIPSFNDMAYQGDLNGGSDVVYEGYARPGSATSAAVWQIKKNTYSSNKLVAVQWPQDNGIASSEYKFVWDNRASYTYS